MNAIDRVLPVRWFGTKALGLLAFAGFLAALLGYGGALAYTTLASFDVVNMARDGFIDDAYYYFEIAKNLAAGKFSTFDGGITRTNGYHPVWLLLVTPFYWVFDLESALFGIKALEIMLIAGGVCLLALAVRLAHMPWILLFAVLPALYLEQGMLFGMEAAAGAFFLGATLLAAVLFMRDAERWRWLFAAIAFLLPWVRLEYVAIALVVTGGLALLPRGTIARGSWRRYFSVAWMRVEGVPLFAAIAGVLVYFAYNGLVFGGILPVSAATKIAWSDDWDADDAVDRMAELGRLAGTAGEDALVVAELCVYAALVWGVARFRGWNKDTGGLLAVLVTTLALGVENLAVKGQVVWQYSARIETYTFWYYVPGYLVAALMVPVRCFVIVFLLRRLLPDRRASLRRLAVAGVCAGGLAFSFDPYQFTEPFRFVVQQRHSPYIMDNPDLAQAHVAFEQMLPRDAVIGSWDAGAIGYFAKRPVVNLDGLVNSYDYLWRDRDKWRLWLQQGGVQEFGVTHLVNLMRGTESAVGFEYVGRHVVMPSVPYALKMWPHGHGRLRTRSWRSITSPSLGVDGERTGYRIVRHGRLVRVFVPDCAPGGVATNVPEMLSFVWQEGRVRRTARLWPRPHRTELGYCTMPFLLPHGAEKADRIFVEPTTVDRVVANTPPVSRSARGDSVYNVGNRLIYVHRPAASEPPANCLAEGEDLGSYYFLHIHPVARRDLPLARQQHGFANYDGPVNAMRREVGGRCLADVALPAIDIGEVWTGELDGGEVVWRERIDGLALQPAAIAGFLAVAEPIVRAAAWNVFRHEGARKLLFVREGGMAAEDSAGCDALPVFLQFHPKRVGDLPTWQQARAYASYEFDFGEVGFSSAGRCFAAVRLPEYSVSQLTMGSPGRGRHVWRAE